MTTATPPTGEIETLREEIAELKKQLEECRAYSTHMTNRVTELEKKLGIKPNPPNLQHLDR